MCLAPGVFGIANMWFAIFADVGVMILAILNAIWALRVKNQFDFLKKRKYNYNKRVANERKSSFLAIRFYFNKR